MQVVVKKVDQLTSKEYQTCYSLNLRNKGMMRGKLKYLRRRKLGWAFMIFEGDELMSWALVFNAYYSASDEKGAYFYTRVNARGKGYGTAVLAKVKQFHGQVTCYPWNTVSDRFFSKRRVGRNYGFWQSKYERYVA